MKNFIIACIKYFIIMAIAMMTIMISINTCEEITWFDIFKKIKEKFSKRKIIEVKGVESEE